MNNVIARNNFVWVAFLILCFVAGASEIDKARAQALDLDSLSDARLNFKTTLIRRDTAGETTEPPPNIFRLVTYPSAIGELAAYISTSPNDGRKHPAIIWIVGGFANSISKLSWTSCPPKNDQSGSAFREAGIIMMYPSLRGGNNNPGCFEGFYGEVDDVLNAITYLKKQDYVDPQRIYLGGHSTGGTLALLVDESETTNQLRAVFSFGPIYDIRSYGAENLPFNLKNLQEVKLRSPGYWLSSIRTPVFVFEGTNNPSNIGPLRLLARKNQNPLIQFFPIDGATHFSTLAPETRLIATKILADTNATFNISFKNQEVNDAFEKGIEGH